MAGAAAESAALDRRSEDGCEAAAEEEPDLRVGGEQVTDQESALLRGEIESLRKAVESMNRLSRLSLLMTAAQSGFCVRPEGHQILEKRVKELLKEVENE